MMVVPLFQSTFTMSPMPSPFMSAIAMGSPDPGLGTVKEMTCDPVVMLPVAHDAAVCRYDPPRTKSNSPLPQVPWNRMPAPASVVNLPILDIWQPEVP